MKNKVRSQQKSLVKVDVDAGVAKQRLDDLFRGVKKAKQAAEPKQADVPKETKTQAQAPPSKGSADDLFGNAVALVKNRKVTEEGWPVYSVEELGLSTTGGDTADCPFDCNCCF